MITGKQLYEIATSHVYRPQVWEQYPEGNKRMWEGKAKRINKMFIKESVDEQTDDGQGFPQESP